jgi:hypothetical protein
VTRKSLALYYYTNGRPEEEISDSHTTLFQERPGEDLGQPRFRLKDLAKELLPPVVTRLIKSHSRQLGPPD